jgi:hypothetical protein
MWATALTTSPPKEVVLRIFVVLKNQPLSAGFEPQFLVKHGLSYCLNIIFIFISLSLP